MPESISGVVLQTVNNDMAYTSNPVTANVVQNGKLVFFWASIDFTNISDFGTGGWELRLPVSCAATFITGGGHLTDASKGRDYFVNGECDPGESTAKLYYYSGNSSELVPLTASAPISIEAVDSMILNGLFVTE